MIRSSLQALHADVIPQAIFWRPLLYFTPSFREDEDNLDKFYGVSLTIDNDLSFDLRTYRGHPEYTVSVYFAFSMQREEEIVAAVEMVVSAVALPPNAIAWRRGWDFEFGSLRRKEEDRLRESEARILALKIAARAPNGRATTEQVKDLVPNYYPLSDVDHRPYPSRGREPRWRQIMGNVVSHQNSLSSIFAHGLAIRTEDGLSVTKEGFSYLKSIGFAV